MSQQGDGQYFPVLPPNVTFTMAPPPTKVVYRTSRGDGSVTIGVVATDDPNRPVSSTCVGEGTLTCRLSDFDPDTWEVQQG